MSEKTAKNKLKAENILVAEFEYIAETSLQAHEDRARVSTFYMVSVASFVGAIIGSQIDNSQVLNIAFSALFLMLSSFGALTLLQLIRLRQAWFESAKAMNQIKDFAIQNAKDLKLDDAFRWQKRSMPKPYKPWSISFMLALQVAVLGGITLGSTIYYIGLVAGYLLPIWATIGGLLFFFAQIITYRHFLK